MTVMLKPFFPFLSEQYKVEGIACSQMSDAKVAKTCNLDDVAKISYSGKVFWDLSIISPFSEVSVMIAQRTDLSLLSESHLLPAIKSGQRVVIL